MTYITMYIANTFQCQSHRDEWINQTPPLFNSKCFNFKSQLSRW